MAAEVLHGPWGTKPVEQTAKRFPGCWWRRADDGQLWVWCGIDGSAESWHRAPVPMAKVRGPKLPDRSPNRDRITMALDSRGLDGPEVDEALGVADALDTVVDSWEDGSAVPTEEQLLRLATLTGYPPTFFYKGTIPRMENGWMCGIEGVGGCQRTGEDR